MHYRVERDELKGARDEWNKRGWCEEKYEIIEVNRRLDVSRGQEVSRKLEVSRRLGVSRIAEEERRTGELRVSRRKGRETIVRQTGGLNEVWKGG